MQPYLALAVSFLALGCAKPAPTLPGQALKIERLENGCISVERAPGDGGLRVPQIVCGATPMPVPTE